MKNFYSNGKLLITGEYAVLDGATAFALPTKFGQSLTVTEISQPSVHWKSYDSDESIWFETSFPLDEICDLNSENNDSVKTTLIKILYEASLLNPNFLISQIGFSVETRLTFPRFWGLGTSSTLINNIAQWFEIDAFTLLQNSFGGSGYDIACAQNDTPILYTRSAGKPIITTVDFNPDFASSIYFIYLNRKQSSKSAIASYHAERKDNSETLSTISQITLKAINAKSADEFSKIMRKHEMVLSEILQMNTIKEQLFSDFDGTLKSLGGWGGDFIMAISETDPTSYFFEKGYRTVIPFREMIL